ncbi:MAG: hypothetical protein MUE56_04360 [Ignavibacteria bacterium]|nr:hypothetical protein [Ignavibacteria bacterium]
MKISLVYIPVIVVLLNCCTGCFFFKKDVMNDAADDVEEAIIASSGGEKFLVMKEEIFQATSKSSKQGITTTTGYSEYRMSSYNLGTGELVRRIELGERDEGYQYFMGSTEGKLWYVSIDEKMGFHARDPKTLDIIVTQEDIVKANTFLKDNFPKVKWYELRRYFGFNIQKNIPLVSDNSGVIYEINPDTYKAERVTGSMTNLNYEENTENTSISVNDKISASLTGSPRKYIRIGSKEFQDLDFLGGSFLHSSSPYNPGIIYPEYYGPVYKELELKQKKVDSLKKLLENFSENEKELKHKVRYLEGEIRHENGELERLNKKLDKTENNRFNSVISPDGGFFIIHNTSASDTAKVMISKVSFGKNKDGVKLEWTTVIDNIFSEPEKVYEKGGFEYVFSKGSPDLKTKRVVFSGDKLVYVSMLKAVCLNMTDGKILWRADI